MKADSDLRPRMDLQTSSAKEEARGEKERERSKGERERSKGKVALTSVANREIPIQMAQSKFTVD